MNIEHRTSQIDHAPTGRAYWRSVEEHAASVGAVGVAEAMGGEFQGYSPEEIREGGRVSRRTFLQLGAAGMALAGLTMTGCRRWPERKLAPYAERPEGFMPGEPVQYATMSERGGVALGLLAESFDGRPIKIEGNPLHPGSLGATDLYAQASILDLYDVDRARMISHGEDETATWEEFAKQAAGWMQGGGVAVLSEATASPSLLRVREAFLKAHPGATWTFYEPVHRDRELQGLKDATGQEVRASYDFSKARIIASFDSDLLGSHPDWVRNARGWADRRRLLGDADVGGGGYSRMYVAEPSFTVTGSNADERLAVGASDVGAAVRLVAAALGFGQAAAGDEERLGGRGFIKYLVRDLQAARGESIVAVGPDQPAELHALAHRLNLALGNVGKTVTYLPEPVGFASAQAPAFRELMDRMAGGAVKTLLILGGNPVYDAPPAFAAALAKVEHAAHLAFTYNETSALCGWRLPMAHYLECWGDGRSWDGTVSIQQPLILPLFDGKSPAELLAMLTPGVGAGETEGYDIVRTTFGEQFLGSVEGDGFESRWRKVLHAGVLEGSAFEAVSLGAGGVSPSADMPAEAGTPGAGAGTPAVGVGTPGGFEVQFRPDPSVFDGRYANNGWLQELPDPMTKVCWDNPALINVHDADALGVETGEMLAINVGDATLSIPAYVMPGQARGTVTLGLGYGRTAAGRIGGVSSDNTVGFDAYPLYHAANTVTSTPIAISVTRGSGSHDLAMTQHHHLIELDRVGKSGVKKRAGPRARTACSSARRHWTSSSPATGPSPRDSTTSGRSPSSSSSHPTPRSPTPSGPAARPRSTTPTPGACRST